MILIAEPEEAIRESIEMVLIDEGYDCHAVSDTDSLIRAIHLHESNLIIADIHLIHDKIEEILEAIQQYPHSPPILVTMTYERIRDMLDLIRFGVGEYLLKPFQFEEMIDRVHKIIEHSEHKKNAGEEP